MVKNMEKRYWERIRELREDRDIKQSEISNLLHTTQQMYSRYENGINELPLRHLKTLCQYYHVSADYILGLTNNPQINDHVDKSR